MTKIKICGLSRFDDIQFVNESMPDYVGFVFAKGSKRQISLEHAAYLKSLLKIEIKSVGVFVNQENDFINRLCFENIIDFVQLHGDEDDNISFSKPIIRAMRIGCSDDVRHTKAEYALFDTYRLGHYGGTGESFDWSLVKGYKKPFFLAGGLNKNNVVESIEAAIPYCVDVSSGVETDGIKDRDKIIELINMVRSLKNYE